VTHKGEVGVLSGLEAARQYVRRGWAVVPIPRGEKAPVITGWPSLRLFEQDLPQHFASGENVGIILGAASGGLVDVDLDSPQAIAVANFFLPQTGLIHGRPSKPRSHCWYTCSPTPMPQRFSDPDGTCLVEIRSDGQQTIVPSSVHKSGELLVWHADEEPASVNARQLADAVAHVAAAALLANHWPVEGSRNHAANAVAGMLLRAGWGEEQTARFIEAVATAAGDDEFRQRVRDVVSTVKRLMTGRTTTGAPTLAQIVSDEVVRRVRQWLALGVSAVGAASDWPDPAPLGDELLSVPSFDVELLPTSFRPLVEDISERMQAPTDYAAAATIVALAGCVNRRAFIVPKQDDKSWRVVPNLWGAIVAPPGMMKSPILRAITLPLTQIEERFRAEFESACGDFEIEKEQAELRRQAWREQYKQAIKKAEPPPIQPDKTLPAPVQKRLVTTDATFEKLHEILAQNPAGVLVVRDELTGWLSMLGRLGREGERAFFLQAWNGDSGFTVDRIGRGSIYVPAVCVSLLGNIQPARLRSYLADAIEGGPTDDGLFQRFQILVWPDPPHKWHLVDRPANEIALQAAEQIFSVLAGLSADDPVRMHFAADAQQLFYDWWADLEKKVRGDSGLAPALVAHLAKYRSLMPTIAGLFELADRAAAGEMLSGEVSISLQHARQAAALCDFFEAHARRVYGCVISPETRSARELARHIQAGDLPSTFTTRSAYLKGWGALDTPERVRGALALLEEAGWVRRAESPLSTSGGRPSEVWLVSPKVARREK
jgi:hypothetical protein